MRMAIHWVAVIGLGLLELLGIVALWVGKRWVDSRFKRLDNETLEGIKAKHATDLETLKSDLTDANSQKLEAVRAELAVQMFEHEQKFSVLHKQRVRIASELYSLLNKAQMAAAFAVSPVGAPGDDDRVPKIDAAMKALNHADGYFKDRRPLIPAGACVVVEQVLRDAQQAMYAIRESHRLDRQGDSKEEVYETWRRAILTVTDAVGPAMRSLEVEIRKLLGDQLIVEASEGSGRSD